MKSHNIKTNFFLALIMLMGMPLTGQDILLKNTAVELALEHNFDIKVANNNIDIARNNTDRKNNGFLPTVTARAGSTYSNSKVKRANDTGLAFNPGGPVLSYNSSLNVDYSIYDGKGRQYNFAKNQQNAVLSELQARGIIEGALVSIFQSYYEVARLTQNEHSQKQTLAISKNRLKRSEYSFQYGQSTQLDVLNAEVDVNTDSINYLNIIQQLENSKRDLNLLLGRDVNIEYSVDTILLYAQNLSLQQITDEAFGNNTGLLQAQSQIELSKYDLQLGKSALLPSIDANASYGWTKTDYESTSNFTDITVLAPSAGLSLNWNIFDGGASSIRIQNAKIAQDNSEILRKQINQQLLRDINNAWSIYQTSLFVMEAQSKNLQTNERNFNRTEEQNKLGQVTSIEFRQAQLNLLTAKLNYNEAKYAAKNAELALMQLSGNLMNAEF